MVSNIPRGNKRIAESNEMSSAALDKWTWTFAESIISSNHQVPILSIKFRSQVRNGLLSNLKAIYALEIEYYDKL